MPLIESTRYSDMDLRRWNYWEHVFAIHARMVRLASLVTQAESEVVRFSSFGSCYCGVSWGKDSTVLADLVHRVAPVVPLVWVRVDDYNPDCLLVRDEFLGRYPSCRYDEIRVPLAATQGRGSKYIGDASAPRHGSRYISGVRAQESGSRRRRMMHFGASTAGTCAPLGWWSGDDVFAYLIVRDLPIHPAYACLMDGLLDPRRIRVSALGGDRGQRTGDGVGRKQWEDRYYRDELRRA